MMSVWEQRTSQIRKHMRASNEALYSEELSPRLASSQHLRPDLTTHLDRPLVVEPRCWDESRNLQGQAGTPQEPTDPAIVEPLQSHPPRKHHRRRERTSEDTQENGEMTGNSREGRRHVHHSRSSREPEATHCREGKGERSHRHHHQQSSAEDGKGGGGGEREHRHHHSHRTSREGNGVLSSGGRSERRSHHRDGSRSGTRDGRGERRGDDGVNGGRRRHRQRTSKAQSTLEGEEQRENGEREEGKSPGHR